MTYLQHIRIEKKSFNNKKALLLFNLKLLNLTIKSMIDCSSVIMCFSFIRKLGCFLIYKIIISFYCKLLLKPVCFHCIYLFTTICLTSFFLFYTVTKLLRYFFTVLKKIYIQFYF